MEEELLEKYPYLKDYTNKVIFVSEEEEKQISESPKILVGSFEVPSKLLEKIVKDDRYFEYAAKFFLDEIPSIDIKFIINGDFMSHNNYSNYTKVTIIKGLERLIDSNKIELEPYQKQRFDALKNYISLNTFLEKYKNESFNIEIENNNYSIPVIWLLQFLNMNNDQIQSLCSNDKIKTINNITKEHFVYASINFIKQNKILDNYLVTDNIKYNYININRGQIIDIEAINKHLDTTETKYKTINLDNNLKNAIISQMPNDLSQLEKAIYIYIKMCKLLTYDEEYFAVAQKGQATEKHKTEEYISTINLVNNKVVCYEFNLIYSRLLSELGINFSTDYSTDYYHDDVEDSYGEGHANLEFRSGKFLIFADSVTSILQGDIMQAKLNQPLVGLKCINKNYKTQDEFKELRTKVYKIIASQDKTIETTKDVEHTQNLDELLKEYSSVTTNIQEVSLEERLLFLIEKVNSSKLSGIDAYSYVLQLKKILFNETQRSNNINVTIIRNNETNIQDKVTMPIAIVTINDESIIDNPDNNLYYYYIPNLGLVSTNKEDINQKFIDGTYEYINDENTRIPGIDGGIKK